MRSIIAAFTFFVFTLPSVLASATDELSAICKSPKLLSQSFTGADKDVQVSSYACDDVGGNSTHTPRSVEDDSSLTKKGYSNVCGAQCTFTSFDSLCSTCIC